MQDMFRPTYLYMWLFVSYLCPTCISQVLQYSSVSYTAPQMLPVTASQPYTTVCINTQSELWHTHTHRHTCVFSMHVCLRASLCMFLTVFLLTDRLKTSPRSLLMWAVNRRVKPRPSTLPPRVTSMQRLPPLLPLQTHPSTASPHLRYEAPALLILYVRFHWSNYAYWELTERIKSCFYFHSKRFKC